MICRGDWVEWSFGGLARVVGDPFTQYKRLWVQILPVNTGDPSTGTGLYSRRWPVSQLNPTKLEYWDYDSRTNKYTRRVVQ